ELIKKHAPYKLLKITFEMNGIKKEQVEKYGEVIEFNSYRAVIKVARSNAKKVAIALLYSSLPVDDILIDEVEIDDVIRKVFGK
ncbi:ABC transporter, partial [Patescibacteria group bacterium]|nr:ABC transporter [Patescibacteria group bacterium]